MPDVSEAQARLMRAVAHGWKKPGGGGPSEAVGKEFVAADKAAGNPKLPAKKKKMSEGGVVEEKEKHFHVTHPDGHTFMVAKHNLSDATLKKLRGMCKGGVAMAGGGEAPKPEDVFTLPPVDFKLDPSSGAPAGYEDVWDQAVKSAIPSGGMEGNGGIRTPEGQPVSVPLPQGGRTQVNPVHQPYVVPQPGPPAQHHAAAGHHSGRCPDAATPASTGPGAPAGDCHPGGAPTDGRGAGAGRPEEDGFGGRCGKRGCRRQEAGLHSRCWRSMGKGQTSTLRPAARCARRGRRPIDAGGGGRENRPQQVLE